MRLDVRPLGGVGPVTIGTPLRTAEDTLANLEGFIPPDPLRPPQGAFFSYRSGLSIALHGGSDGSIIAVEVYRPDDDIVAFEDIDVFRTPAEDFIALLSSRTAVRLEEGGQTLIAPDLSVSFWRGTLPEFPGDEDGRYFESVLVARAGYFAAPGSPIDPTPAVDR